MSFDQQEFETRQRRIRERMQSEGFDALIAYSSAKVRGCVRYLSSYYTRWTGAQSLEGGGYSQFGSCALLFPLEGEPADVGTDTTVSYSSFAGSPDAVPSHPGLGTASNHAHSSEGVLPSGPRPAGA